MPCVFRQPLIVALGVVFAGATSLADAAAVNSSFRFEPLVSGYALAGDGKDAHADSEGKCGEGKCGLGMMDTNKDGKVSLEESKAGKFSEHQFKAWGQERRRHARQVRTRRNACGEGQGRDLLVTTMESERFLHSD